MIKAPSIYDTHINTVTTHKHHQKGRLHNNCGPTKDVELVYSHPTCLRVQRVNAPNCCAQHTHTITKFDYTTIADRFRMLS